MAHDVFISYSTENKAIAEAVCAQLESDGIRCWIAPRDVPPGRDYSEVIHEAIDTARVFVLIFSSQADASKDVHREVKLAADRELTLIPFKIDDCDASRGLSYFLGATHWLDAISPPLERHIERLSDTIRSLIGEEKAGDRGEVARPAGPRCASLGTASRAPFRPTVLLSFGIFLVIAGAAVGVWFVASLWRDSPPPVRDTALEMPLADFQSVIRERIPLASVTVEAEADRGWVRVTGWVFSRSEIEQARTRLSEVESRVEFEIDVNSEHVSRLVREAVREAGGRNVRTRVLRSESRSPTGDRLLVQFDRTDNLDVGRARIIVNSYFFDSALVQIEAF